MKKVNKVLLSLATLSGLSVSLLSAACNKSLKFDQAYDGIVKVATGFSETNEQGLGIKGIIDAYNNWLNSGTAEEKLERKEKGYLPVEPEFLPNGYNTGSLTTKLAAKESKTFWNILLNYPTAASILAQNKMNLAMSNDEFEKLGIANAFKNTNDPIGGNIEKEKWIVPLSISTEMQAINKWVLGKLLSELKEEAEVKIASDKSKKINEYINYYKNNKNKSKKDFIDKKWKADKTSKPEEAKANIKKLNITELSDTIFESYTDIVKFAVAAKYLYPNNLDRPILGIDSLASAINVMNSSQSKGDLTKGYITPSPEHTTTGGYDYDSWLVNGTAQNKVFKDILRVLFEGIRTGAIWVGGGGAYGSNLLTKHNMALSIGSTAGFNHTFISAKEVKVKSIDDKDNKKHEIDDRKILNLLEYKKNKNANEIILEFKSGRNTNKIFSHNAKNKEKYDKQFASEEMQKSFVNALSKQYDKILLALEYDKDSKQIIVSRDSKGSIEKSFILSEANKNKIVPLGQLFKDDKEKYSLIDKDLLKEEIIQSSGLLNKDDADWLSAPQLKKAGDKKSVFMQGPSMVLIHANERENKATKLFINWMFTHKNSSLELKNRGRDSGHKVYKDITGVDAFNRHSNYISPTNSYFDEKNKENITKNLNEATKLAYEEFNKANKDKENYQLADDVASVLSDKLRDAIGSAGRKMVSKVSSKNVIKFEDFLKEIQGLFQ